MRKQMLALAALLVAFLLPASVWAADTDAGVVLAAEGQVSAKGADGQSRALARRSAINSGDTIMTGANSKTQLRMKDGTVLALEANTEFKVVAYTSKAAGDAQDLAALKLVKGGLMQVSGNMEKSAYSLETPVSTLGIRGTVFVIRTNPDGSVTATVNQGEAVVAAKAKTAKQKGILDDAQAALEAAQANGDADAIAAAEAALAAATEAYNTAVANEATVVGMGDSSNTGTDGQTSDAPPIEFTGATPEEVLQQVISLLGPEAATDLVGPMSEAFPESAQAIKAAAQAAGVPGVEGGTGNGTPTLEQLQQEQQEQQQQDQQQNPADQRTDPVS